MKFALLGDSPQVVPLARAIANHPDHTLTHAALVNESLPAIQECRPSLRRLPDWEDLLGEDSIEAIIVAGHDEAVLEGAKKLATEGHALLLLPEAKQELTFIYELALIRDDSPVLLFPALPLRVHPQVRKLAGLIERGVLGDILHMQCEREVRSAEASSLRLISIADIDQALLPDIDLLRALGGEYNQVTALRSGAQAQGVSVATVSLVGEQAPETTWSIRGMADDMLWRLTVAGSDGVAVLSGGDDLSSLKLAVDGADVDDSPAVTETELGTLLLERFEAACDGEQVSPNWTDLTRAFEIVDATHRSVRRRRTIDLYFETTSERSIFKTQMTALGCGVLTFTFFGLLLYLAVASFFDINRQILQIARILWFLPLAIFLALQLLLLVARPSASESPANDSATNRAASEAANAR